MLLPDEATLTIATFEHGVFPIALQLGIVRFPNLFRRGPLAELRHDAASRLLAHRHVRRVISDIYATCEMPYTISLWERDLDSKED